MIRSCADPITGRRRAYEERGEQIEPLKNRIAAIERALDEGIPHRKDPEWFSLKNVLFQLGEQLAQCESCRKSKDCPFELTNLNRAAIRQVELKGKPFAEGRVGGQERSERTEVRSQCRRHKPAPEMDPGTTNPRPSDDPRRKHFGSGTRLF
jgi:hypothetical protein